MTASATRVDPDLTGPRLNEWLADVSGSRETYISRAELLEGGAVQQNWALDVAFSDGKFEGTQALVLRANFQTPLPASRSKAVEFETLCRVRAAGIAAPEPLFLCPDPSVIGAPFFVMRRLPGSAARMPLLDAAARNGFGEALAAELARELVALHALPVAGDVSCNAARALIAEYRTWLADLPDDSPVLTRAIDRLDAYAPARPTTTLVHRDFRTGNFLVVGGRLSAILDWEFAGSGDPAEDIGWLCARCWRGGRDALEAGGLTTRTAFLAVYEAAGGAVIPPDVIDYWEIMAHIRWALVARQQWRRAAAGDTPRHELVEAAGRIAGLDRDIAAMIG